MSNRELLEHDKKMRKSTISDLGKFEANDDVEIDWDSLDGIEEISFDDLISIDE